MKINEIMNEMMAECCGDDGEPDAKQMKQLFGDCNCRSGSRCGS